MSQNVPECHIVKNEWHCISSLTKNDPLSMTEKISDPNHGSKLSDKMPPIDEHHRGQ